MAIENESFQLLAQQVRLGESEAREELFRFVVTELRRIAIFLLQREPPDIELERDVLVDDAFMELTEARYVWKDLREFYRAALFIMRHKLIDHYRERRSFKRGSGWQRLEVDPDKLIVESDVVKVLELKEAIERLWKFHPYLAEAIEVYSLCGESIENAADILGLRPETIKRRRDAARAYLKGYLGYAEFEHLSFIHEKTVASKELVVPRVLLFEGVAVQLTLDIEINSFDEREQQRFLKSVKRILDSPNPIKLVSVKPGSTKVTITVTVEQAEQLLWLYHRGVLKELRVKDAKIIGDEAAAAMIRYKSHSELYDVFLCHNSKDKSEVRRIALHLRNRGILPWLDEWELRPGVPWQQSLEGQIEKISSAAVFVGNSGFGPWQDMEMNAFIREFVKRKCPVIPVVLKSCKIVPQLPPFLNGMTWVNFHKRSPDPYELLIWGITGKKL